MNVIYLFLENLILLIVEFFEEFEVFENYL